MRVIGLTGGIGTGKSEAANVLADLGAAVIDADIEGHRAYAKGSIGWRRILEIFSSAVLDGDGEIDRAQLGVLVFSNPQALAWLNAAVHPLIRQRLSQAIEQRREDGSRVAVVNAALLYQAAWDDLTDEVWAVSASPAAVVERLRARGMTPEDVQRRIEAQGRTDLLLARADVVIDNSGSREEFGARIRELWEERILSKGSAAHGRAD